MIHCEPDPSLRNAIDDLRQQQSAVLLRCLAGTDLATDVGGWRHPDTLCPPHTLQRIGDIAARLQALAEVLVVVGVGGSIATSRAVLQALAVEQNRITVLFAGNHLSGRELALLQQRIGGRRLAVIGIAKNCQTIEPMLGLRFAVNLQFGLQDLPAFDQPGVEAYKQRLRTLLTTERT